MLSLYLQVSVNIFSCISQIAPMLVQNTDEVPEYEINPNELDFSKSVNITKVSRQKLIAFVLCCQISLIHFLFP